MHAAVRTAPQLRRLYVFGVVASVLAQVQQGHYLSKRESSDDHVLGLCAPQSSGHEAPKTGLRRRRRLEL
eukprot:scaffold30926_cov62-Phaeocystis_antarctica.AAC.2